LFFRIGVMDIKGALNQLIPIQSRTKEPVQKAIKSDSTADRDANGQQSFGGQQQQQREPMTDEELQKALEHLRSLSAVKDHQLLVELTVSAGHRFVLLKEANGKVIRRIPEAELWSLQIMQEDKKGQILNKSA
jgi:uncharacterized FlaG/YvyC family protein